MLLGRGTTRGDTSNNTVDLAATGCRVALAATRLRITELTAVLLLGRVVLLHLMQGGEGLLGAWRAELTLGDDVVCVIRVRLHSGVQWRILLLDSGGSGLVMVHVLVLRVVQTLLVGRGFKGVTLAQLTFIFRVLAPALRLGLVMLSLGMSLVMLDRLCLHSERLGAVLSE